MPDLSRVPVRCLLIRLEFDLPRAVTFGIMPCIKMFLTKHSSKCSRLQSAACFLMREWNTSKDCLLFVYIGKTENDQMFHFLFVSMLLWVVRRVHLLCFFVCLCVGIVGGRWLLLVILMIDKWDFLLYCPLRVLVYCQIEGVCPRCLCRIFASLCVSLRCVILFVFFLAVVSSDSASS